MAGPFVYLTIPPRKYDAPFLQINISFGGRTEPILALIDSGADGSVIPKRIVDSLSLQRTSDETVQISGETEPSHYYLADIAFAGNVIVGYPLASVRKRKYAVIGQDLLLRYNVSLNGPSLSFTIE
jgi:predicted aspartyl protease